LLTIHRPALGLRRTADAPVEEGQAVVVDGSCFAAIGSYDDLHRGYGARARVRDWDGVLGPGRYEPDAVALLESAYWPDPREAEELGTDPLTGDALVALAMTGTEWGKSARRGIQRLMARGVTRVPGPYTRPAVAIAVDRSGLRVVPASPGQVLAQSGPADFVVHGRDGGCLATVLDGRLVFRRR
jgi:hypothetical protein